MTNPTDLDPSLARLYARRVLAGAAGTFIAGLALFGPSAQADDCEPYVEICGTTTTTDQDSNTTVREDGTTSTTLPTGSSTSVGRPGDGETTTTTTEAPTTTTTSIPRAETGFLPVTGGDIIGLTVIGASALAGGTYLVRRSQRA
jgi:hypothetical protein